MAMVAPQVGVGSQVGAAQPQPSPSAAELPATNAGPPPTVAAASAVSASPPSSDLPQGADDQRMRPEDFSGAAAREEEDARRRAARGGVELLSVRFNQDSSCFAVGTSVGFRLFSCEPMRETIRRDFNRGGVGFVEMLFRCNFMAVVGGGPNPQYPPNKVMIWDDNQSRCIGELMFRSEVRAVRLRRDRVVVVGEHKVYVYNFADLKLVHQIETTANPRGLCAVSQAQGNMVLACPGIHASHVRLELFDMNRTHFVAAHDSPVACMALTLDGTRLATASERGTLVRIFNTADGTQLQEVRRGKDRADIYSIAFAPRTPHLAVSSSRGTIHVFALNAAAAATHSDRDGAAAAAAAAEAAAAGGSSNPASSLGLLKGVLPKYFSSEWSMAQFHLPHDDALAQSYAAFGAEAAIVNVVCTNGTFYRLRFDPNNKGDMRMEEVVRFLEGRESQ